MEIDGTEYITKDSGITTEFESGMVRDNNKGKARFDLLIAEGIPYNEQILTRFANLMERGLVRYTVRNWEKASGQEELDRFKESALRHMIQWCCGETDEDHAVAVFFNIMGYETTKYKLTHGRDIQADTK